MSTLTPNPYTPTCPIGFSAGMGLPISDYEPAGILSLGNGATSFDGIALMQYRTDFGLFSELQMGYSFRDDSDFDIPDAMLYSIKLGYFCELFYAHAKLGVQNSQSGFDIGSPAFVNAGGLAAIPETDVDFANLDLSLYVPIGNSDIGISLSYIETLSGRNLGNSSSYALGLVYSN